jgi:hypothetical protein
MRNTADVTGGKPIAVLLQSISGVSAINPLDAFYDINGGKREVLFFYFVLDTTRDGNNHIIKYYKVWQHVRAGVQNRWQERPWPLPKHRMKKHNKISDGRK